MADTFEWLERFKDEMRLRAYSPRTVKSYVSHLRVFGKAIAPRTPGSISDEEVRTYLLRRIDKDGLSAETINQHINALKFLFEEIIRRPLILGQIHRPRRSKKLPVVPDREFLLEFLESIKNIKHKAMLMLAYGGGLRLRETTQRLPTDIDSRRMLIRVKQAKGKKDRFTLLSKRCLIVLREYFKKERPKKWLFEGETPGTPYSPRSLEEVFKKLARKAGLPEEMSFHTLRHAFATHLLERGHDIRYIQQLLGHASVRTTEKYTHVTIKKLGNIKSPLDDLED